MANENLTGYVEEDDNNKLTVTAPKALAADVDWDEDVYLYKDYGANRFDALDIDFEVYSASTCDDNALGFMGLSNSIEEVSGFAATDLYAGAQLSTADFTIQLGRGAGVAADFYASASNTPYYPTLRRTAGNDSCSLDIYDDSGRTNKVDTLVVAGYGTAKWRNAYGFVNFNGSIADRNFDGYIQNLNFNWTVVTPTTLALALTTYTPTLIAPFRRLWRIRIGGVTYGVNLTKLT